MFLFLFSFSLHFIDKIDKTVAAENLVRGIYVEVVRGLVVVIVGVEVEVRIEVEIGAARRANI